MTFVATNAATRTGIGGIVGNQASLFEGLASQIEENEFVNRLREEIKTWRSGGYSGTALVTRRLLEWWFERDEERKALGKHFFFCQQEAIEAVIYLYEVQKRRKPPGTGDLLRYAMKLATGTGKTVVMALLSWSTLHKRKVSGSTLSNNFLVLVPNLTVKDRVSGVSRGDGLDPAGEANLYKQLTLFHRNIRRNSSRIFSSRTGIRFRSKPSARIGLVKTSWRKVVLFPPRFCAPCDAAPSKTRMPSSSVSSTTGEMSSSSTTRHTMPTAKSAPRKARNPNISDGVKSSRAFPRPPAFHWSLIFLPRLGMAPAPTAGRFALRMAHLRLFSLRRL